MRAAEIVHGEGHSSCTSVTKDSGAGTDRGENAQVICCFALLCPRSIFPFPPNSSHIRCGWGSGSRAPNPGSKNRFEPFAEQFFFPLLRFFNDPAYVHSTIL